MITLLELVPKDAAEHQHVIFYGANLEKVRVWQQVNEGVVVGGG